MNRYCPMSDSIQINILLNNTNLFISNIKVFKKLRPKITFTIDRKNNVVSNNAIDVKTILDELRALNSAIILNCFSLFESSYEWRLLHELTTRSLAGIQKRVMSRYIDDIIKISSVDNYSKEYKFITGKSIAEFFSKDEYKLFLLIKDLYLIRNLLVHGSSIKHIKMVGDTLEFDDNDNSYKKIINQINKYIDPDISPNLSNLDSWLLSGEFVNFFISSTLTVSKKLSLANEKTFMFIS